MTMPAAILMSRSLHSIPAPSLTDYRDECDLSLFCIAFRPDNNIHLFPPAKQTAKLLKDTVQENWTLEAEKPDSDCYTILLQGAPFLMYSRRENAILVKYICCQILERFKANGWELVACTDLSNKTDVTAWYFARMTLDEEGRPVSPIENSAGMVCLSLSAKKNLQLINASSILQGVLRELVTINYEPGIDQDTHYGRDYEIKLKGNPWDTEDREEIVAACRLILSVFRNFGAHGYHLYGLVNVKETADSLFFEHDPRQTIEHDRYMIMALDDTKILRLINATPQTVEVVKSVINRFWMLGLDAEGQIGVTKYRSPKKSALTLDVISWEFVLKGSPWQAPSSRIGRSRQLITTLLDALLANGWTVVTGLDISRSLDKKSALLFQGCPAVRGIRHVCMSPLGNQRFQLINAPVSLRRLVKEEFADSIGSEKLSEDQSVYEITFKGKSWWVQDPECEEDSFIYVRKRMGRLLKHLMENNWRVIASADVARQTKDDGDVGEGIHSWFVIYCGNTNAPNDGTIKVTANSVLQVSGRIGSLRPESPFRFGNQLQVDRPSVSVTRSASMKTRRCLSPNTGTRRSRSVQRRAVSPPPISYFQDPVQEARRSRSGYELSWV